MFEVPISTAEIEKRNTTTHMELKHTCAWGGDEDRTKRFQEMCLIVSADY